MNKLLYFFIFIFIVQAHSQDDSIKAKGFKKAEYDKNGKISCIITGDRGTFFGKEAKIEQVIVEIYNKSSPLKLTSPKCNYNMNKKTCSSQENVVITSDGVKITGVGFDIDNQTKQIFIRSQVKVIWKKANLKNATKDNGNEVKK
jgi:LPS export ABC transporter protein LptC